MCQLVQLHLGPDRNASSMLSYVSNASVMFMLLSSMLGWDVLLWLMSESPQLVNS